MTRALSPDTATAIVGPITSPGYLVEILWDTPVRLSSRGLPNGNMTVFGNVWDTWGIAVSGIGVNGTSAIQVGKLQIANTGLDFSALILDQGIVDVLINIWKFYTDSPGDDDPVQLFSGVGGQADFDTSTNIISVTLRQARDSVEYAPNKYCTAENGFSLLPPAGTIITFGSQSYILEPEE